MSILHHVDPSTVIAGLCLIAAVFLVMALIAIRLTGRLLTWVRSLSAPADPHRALDDPYYS